MRRLCWCAMLVMLATCACASAREQNPMVRVQPTEIQDVLANPGMGWQTFHRFADEDRNLHGIPTAAAYFRFGWRELEPEEGKYDFAAFDALLAHAHKAGQKLGFRIMIASSGEPGYAPQWLRDQGVKGWEYSCEGQGKLWVPDLEDPAVKAAHTRLLRAFGARYDGHPDLDYIDIGSVGLWGEWHFSSTQIIPGGGPVPMPSPARSKEIVDEYRRYFPKTPKLMLVGGAKALAHATSHGCGWRADCLGDMGGFSSTWNHMENAYRQEIAAAHAGGAWKQAPVAWETCWTMQKWVDEGWDVRFIFDYGLDFHGSYLNNKSDGIEEKWRPEIDRFLRRLGYRLVLRSLAHPASAAPGAAVPLVVEWENVGVAPPYHDYRVAFRLSQGSETRTFVTDHSIRGWLPGKKGFRTTLPLPTDLPVGRYTLSVGVVSPVTTQAEVRLAIAGRGEDGWYPLSSLEVARGK